jgi:hypothetical protein
VSEDLAQRAEHGFPGEPTELMTPRDPTDHTISGEDHKLRGTTAIASPYKVELDSLWMVPWEKGNLRWYADRPISLRFAFLLACLSRQALDLPRKFLPLPSHKTIQNHHGPQITRIMA